MWVRTYEVKKCVDRQEAPSTELKLLQTRFYETHSLRRNGPLLANVKMNLTEVKLIPHLPDKSKMPPAESSLNSRRYDLDGG